jgi:hypothetical protein
MGLAKPLTSQCRSALSSYYPYHSFSIQCPKLQRRHAGGFAKKAGEIGRIFITQFVRNLPDIKLAVIK